MARVSLKEIRDVFIFVYPFSQMRLMENVLTAWIMRHGEDFPRLTTCYML